MTKSLYQEVKEFNDLSSATAEQERSIKKKLLAHGWIVLGETPEYNGMRLECDRIAMISPYLEDSKDWEMALDYSYNEDSDSFNLSEALDQISKLALFAGQNDWSNHVVELYSLGV